MEANSDKLKNLPTIHELNEIINSKDNDNHSCLVCSMSIRNVSFKMGMKEALERLEENSVDMIAGLLPENFDYTKDYMVIEKPS